MLIARIFNTTLSAFDVVSVWRDLPGGPRRWQRGEGLEVLRHRLEVYVGLVGQCANAALTHTVDQALHRVVVLAYRPMNVVSRDDFNTSFKNNMLPPEEYSNGKELDEPNSHKRVIITTMVEIMIGVNVVNIYGTNNLDT